MFCKNCGKDIGESLYCPYCGTYNGENKEEVTSSQTEVTQNSVNNLKRSYDPDQGILIAAKVFLIIGMIVQGIFIIPLCWVLPIGICSIKKMKTANSAKDLVGFGIASLLLVNLIGGILMLCARDE